MCTHAPFLVRCMPWAVLWSAVVTYLYQLSCSSTNAISMNVMNKSHCAICPHLNSPGKADSRIHGLLLALTVPAVTKFVTERVLSIRTRNVDDGNQRSSGSFPRGHCGLSGGRRKGVSQRSLAAALLGVPSRSPVWIVRQGGHDTHTICPFSAQNS